MKNPAYSKEKVKIDEIDNSQNEQTRYISDNVSLKGSFSITLKGLGFSDYMRLMLRNGSQESCIIVEAISFSSEHPRGSQLFIDPLSLPINLEPLQEIPLVIHCVGKYEGITEEIIILKFNKGDILSQIVEINVEAYSRREFNCRRIMGSHLDRGRVIKGEKPIQGSPFIPIKLPEAKVPSYLWEAILNHENLLNVVPILQEPLSSESYIEKLSTLLFLEEIEMDLQMRKFDIAVTNFSRIGEYLALTVEGLSENRPSLMVGDSVVASPPSNICEDDVKYEGIIHEVLKSQVLLKFHPSFHSNYNEEDYSVQLHFNRTPLRRCHLAISFILKQLGKSILFPSKLIYQLPQIAFLDNDFRMNNDSDDSKSCNEGESNFNVTTLRFGKRSIYTLEFETEGKKFRNRMENHTNFCQENTHNFIRKLDCHPFQLDDKGYGIPVLRSKINKVGFEQRTQNVKWFNELLNAEQKSAVKRIMEGSTRPHPYIIFGPPGTGKTVTLVEAILQIYTRVPHSRILVVSPSNSASDLVAQRCIESGKLKPGELVRINAFNRSSRGIPNQLEPYCTVGNDLKFTLRHRLIVSTTTTAGLFYTAKLRNGHFTHVFIDEAGQLTEPETCVPLGLVNSHSGQIVLAGDPKQLGPMVLSSFSKKYGLSQSLLHRLCSSVLYQPVDPVLKSVYSSEDSSLEIENRRIRSHYNYYYEPTLVTLLVKNYRSHPDLIKVSSSLFYHSLLVSSTKEFVNRFKNWKELPNPDCPLLFHGVKGENMQEGDSPSWFNPSEAYQVSYYAISLLKYGLKPDDIGVIAPYRKQVDKIRKLFDSLGIEKGIKIGPVEEFQGQEKMAIVISTVRSCEDMINTDILHNLGFLKCEQRFNVAITRAIGVLVVIGNPLLLCQDPNWNVFLKYCISQGSIK